MAGNQSVPSVSSEKVLNVIRQYLARAEEHAAVVRAELDQGRVPEAAVAALEAAVHPIVKLSQDLTLPDDMQERITQLQTNLQESVRAGESWLAGAEAELATLGRQWRARQLYRTP